MSGQDRRRHSLVVLREAAMDFAASESAPGSADRRLILGRNLTVAACRYAAHLLKSCGYQEAADCLIDATAFADDEPNKGAS